MLKRTLLLLMPLGAAAQPSTVTIESAVRSALDHHASVRIARAKVDAARARSDETDAMLLPRVELTGRAFQLSDVEQGTVSLPFIPGSPSVPLFPVIRHSYAARLQLTQPLFAGWRLSGASESAGLQARMSEVDERATAADLRLDVEQSYWSWVEALEAQRVLDQAVRQMEEHEAQVQRLADNGLATTSDVLNVRVRRSEVHVQALEMRSRARVAGMRVNFLMGQPLDIEIVPGDMPDFAAAAPVPDDAQRLVAQALNDRPDVAAARLRTDLGSSAETVARSAWFPQVSLAAAYEYANPNQRIVPPADKFAGTWEVGLSFRWTVWDWMTASSRSAQASAQRRQAEAGYAHLQDAVRLEIVQVRQQVVDADERIASARLSVEATEEALRVARDRFATGAGTSLDVTDRNVDLLRARLALTRAAADRSRLRAQLRRASGGGS